MALKDVLKKGSGAPAPADLITGGIGVDTVNKRLYFKADDGTVVPHDRNTPAGDIVATTVQGAINELDTEKAPLASPTFTGTVSGVSKAMVGLGSVDNTTDIGKPISTATQTALDLKAPLASPTFTGTVSGVTKAMVGLGNVDNTTDASKPVSTAAAAALLSAVPSQTGNSDKYLSTDGTSTSWATLNVDALPSQTGNSGKYLTTSGTAASWATLNVDPNVTTKGLYEHSQTISANYTIGTGNNASSVGPLTVASGISIIVPSGSRWMVL